MDVAIAILIVSFNFIFSISTVSVTPIYLNDLTCSYFFSYMFIVRVLLLHLFGSGTLTKIVLVL